MRSSPISLGIVFIVLAAFPVFGVPGGHFGPLGYPLVGLLAFAGILVCLGLRVAFPVGLLAGIATLVVSVLDWKKLGGGHLGLPILPAITAAISAYLIFRVAVARPLFGPRKKLGARKIDPLGANPPSNE